MTAKESVPAVNYWGSHVFNAGMTAGVQNHDTKEITGCELMNIQSFVFPTMVLVSSLTTQERGNYCLPTERGARSSRGSFLNGPLFLPTAGCRKASFTVTMSRLHLGYIPANTVSQSWTLLRARS